jgi:hypothetical protein
MKRYAMCPTGANSINCTVKHYEHTGGAWCAWTEVEEVQRAQAGIVEEMSRTITALRNQQSRSDETIRRLVKERDDLRATIIPTVAYRQPMPALDGTRYFWSNAGMIADPVMPGIDTYVKASSFLDLEQRYTAANRDADALAARARETAKVIEHTKALLEEQRLRARRAEESAKHNADAVATRVKEIELLSNAAASADKRDRESLATLKRTQAEFASLSESHARAVRQHSEAIAGHRATIAALELEIEQLESAPKATTVINVASGAHVHVTVPVEVRDAQG